MEERMNEWIKEEKKEGGARGEDEAAARLTAVIKSLYLI